MTKYTSNINLPDVVMSFNAIINQYAAIVKHHDDSVSIEIEAEDEYELANIVRDIEDELSGQQFEYGYVPDIKRPKAVENE